MTRTCRWGTALTPGRPDMLYLGQEADEGAEAPHLLAVLVVVYDLELLGCGIPHEASSPSPRTLFLSRRFSIRTSARVSLSWRASALSSLTSSEVASRAVSPASRFLPASRNSFDQR